MTTRTAPFSYLAEPTIQYLSQVLEQVHAGDIHFPRFQRYGVWTAEQRKELLRSIREGIPVGTLLLWRTRRTDVELVRKLGVHELPAPRKNETTRQYVLGGVQRLSTLYSAMFPPTDEKATADDGESGDDFRSYYDLRDQDFYFASELDGAPAAYHMPLTALRDSVSLLKFQRALKEKDADILTERSDAIAKAFREYKIPVVPLASDDLLYATKTFQRINTQGTPMSELHMVNALVYSEDFDLIEQIGEVKQEQLAEVGWESVDDDLILRTVKALLKLDVYATQADRTKAALQDRPDAVQESARALVACAGFMRRQFGIRSPSLVPYSIQIVLLARTLWEEPEPTKAGLERLRDWVTLTTYSELFSGGMSASRFDALAEELKHAAKGKPLQWTLKRQTTRRPLPRVFDFRHARARFLALRMAKAGSRNPDDPTFKPQKALAQLGSQAVPKLVTHLMAPTPGDWVRGSGARIIAGEGALPGLRKALFSKKADPDLLESHLISPDVHMLLVASKYREAIQRRENELNEAEAREFAEVIARNARASSSTATTASESKTAAVRPPDLGITLCDWFRDRFKDRAVQWAYHPRSNDMSDFIRRRVLKDLLECSPSLRRDALDGAVACELNLKLVGRTDQARTLDLVLGPPRKKLGKGDPADPIRKAKIGDPWVSLETKSCMTAHGKAIPRLIGELQQSIGAVKTTNSDALAMAVVVVNTSATFTNPLNLPGPNEHDQPQAARSVIDQVLRRVRTGVEDSYDAIAIVVIDFDNEKNATPIDPKLWVPDENTYGRAMQILAARYELLRGG